MIFYYIIDNRCKVEIAFSSPCEGRGTILMDGGGVVAKDKSKLYFIAVRFDVVKATTPPPQSLFAQLKSQYRADNII